MEKKLRHKKTGEIAYYKDGILKSGQCCVEIGVEPSSEFWEEVVDKDFEILSLYPNKNYIGEYQILTDKNNIDSWIQGNTGMWEIFSIKRLSDGEIFSIGNKITGTLSIAESRKGYVEITGFWIYNNKLEVGIETGAIIDNRHLNFSDGTKGSFEFLTMQKYKSLFTTDDGYEIFEGDEYYFVDEKFRFLSNIATYEWKNKLSFVKYFKEKINAENYIVLNKPCLGIKDIQSVYISAKPGYKKNGVEEEYFKNLCDIVKTKL